MPQNEADFLAGADMTPPPSLDTPTIPREEPEPGAQEAPVENPDTTAEGEATADPEPGPEPDDAAKPETGEKKSPWYQSRINELTRARYDEQRRADQLQAEIERLKQGQTAPQPQDPNAAPDVRPAPQPPSQADIDRMANERAVQIANAREFDRQCDRIYDDGLKAKPDFVDALGTFKLLGGLPPTLVEAAIETGKASDVIYELGKNPDEAARILQMSPTRMAVAVARLANKPAPAPAAVSVSKAPAPIKPLSAGASKVETDPDKMSMDQWMKWHDDREAKKRA